VASKPLIGNFDIYHFHMTTKTGYPQSRLETLMERKSILSCFVHFYVGCKFWPCHMYVQAFNTNDHITWSYIKRHWILKKADGSNQNMLWKTMVLKHTLIFLSSQIKHLKNLGHPWKLISHHNDETLKDFTILDCLEYKLVFSQQTYWDLLCSYWVHATFSISQVTLLKVYLLGNFYLSMKGTGYPCQAS
jgi:hypothetical protein